MYHSLQGLGPVLQVSKGEMFGGSEDYDFASTYPETMLMISSDTQQQRGTGALGGNKS